MHILLPVEEYVIGLEMRSWQHPLSDVNPEEVVRRFELHQAVERVLNSLTLRERVIVQMHFCEGYTLLEVGEKFNLPRKEVTRISSRAIRKLRNPSRSGLLQNFL